MRGLPSSGKSHMAKRLAGDVGLIFETDAFFYTHVPGDPTVFKYDHRLLPKAREWSFRQFQKAVQQDLTPLIVDRGNSLHEESAQYVRYAHAHQYHLELVEPDSPWWQEIRILLKYKPATMLALAKWAEKLADMSRNNPPYHNVEAEFIYHLMQNWRSDVTIEKILKLPKI